MSDKMDDVVDAICNANNYDRQDFEDWALRYACNHLAAYGRDIAARRPKNPVGRPRVHPVSDEPKRPVGRPPTKYRQRCYECGQMEGGFRNFMFCLEGYGESVRIEIPCCLAHQNTSPLNRPKIEALRKAFHFYEHEKGGHDYTNRIGTVNDFLREIGRTPINNLTGDDDPPLRQPELQRAMTIEEWGASQAGQLIQPFKP